MTFYDDMKKALSEAIEIEKGKIPMIEVENMPAETYKPKDISKPLNIKLSQAVSGYGVKNTTVEVGDLVEKL